MVSLSNSVSNGKSTMSTGKEALFNEESQRREMGMADRDESRVLVSQESRGTSRGRPRSQSRGRTFTCFYCDQEGHIKINCPKYKADMKND